MLDTNSHKAYWGHEFDLSLRLTWRHRSRDWPFDSHRPFPNGCPLEPITVSEIFDGDCDAMIDMTLKRPLNKDQAHSFWHQSISHIRFPIGCLPLSVVTFALERPVSPQYVRHVQTDRQTDTLIQHGSISAIVSTALRPAKNRHLPMTSLQHSLAAS